MTRARTAELSAGAPSTARPLVASFEQLTPEAAITTRPDPAPSDSFVADAVTAERLALCDLLDTLDPAEWEQRSACPDWTVREVVAHLAFATDDTPWSFFTGMLRARGNFDRMNATAAIERARDSTPQDLVARLRRVADSNDRAPFTSQLDPLIDILIHGQDIARPLGRSHQMRPDRVVPALGEVLTSRWYGAIKRCRDLRLVATDAPWSSGDGAEVSGESGDLLLVASGRTAGLAGLTGPGVETLARRLDT